MSSDERQFYLMAVTLQTRDLLPNIKTSGEAWEISKGLWVSQSFTGNGHLD